MVKSQLSQENIQGQTYWMSADWPVIEDNALTVYLLPGFDEYMLGYTDRSAVLEATHTQKITPGNNGMFSSTLVIDGRVAGTWKRTFKKDKVVIAINPFTSLNEAQSRALNAVAEHYLRFTGMSTVVVSLSS
jgi:hypothetical protein